jgi:4'-phosphopantetheinyl transferase
MPAFPSSNFESMNVFWLTQTSTQIPPNDDWLSAEERNISAGLRFPKRRNDWRLGRWTAKQAIQAYNQAKRDSALWSLEIRSAADGSPEAFEKGEPAGIAISISHSRDRSLCVVAAPSLALGCDLEFIEPREENFTEDYFTPEELCSILQVPVEKALRTTLMWSAKESALKVLRKGLSRDTRSVVIRPEFNRPQESWDNWTGICLESSRIFYGWWRTCEGYMYTIGSDQPILAPQKL